MQNLLNPSNLKKHPCHMECSKKGNSESPSPIAPAVAAKHDAQNIALENMHHSFTIIYVHLHTYTKMKHW